MLIVADENIALLDPFFADIGTVRRVPGRAMTADDVRDADILLVRSVTRVDQALLDGSRVKFVGTATIGTDHIDVDWLAERGITFACAPGSNANSVVEYVLSTLSVYAEQRGYDNWTDLSVGIVGAGNVGERLRQRLDKLGFSVRVSDPPREADGEDDFSPLDEVLGCDVITLHTPLTSQGEWPTRHLIDQTRLTQLNQNQLLINTSRGGVVSDDALEARLADSSAPRVALDVWETEPRLASALADRLWQITPHIAGYSLEGKTDGTEAIYRALCQFLGLPQRKQSGQFMSDPPLAKLAFSAAANARDAAHTAIRATYDVRRDDIRFRRTLLLDQQQQTAAFDELRRDYPVRREFSSVKIQLKGSAKEKQQVFKALGFKLKT